jgi:hypothetical protein
MTGGASGGASVPVSTPASVPPLPELEELAVVAPPWPELEDVTLLEPPVPVAELDDVTLAEPPIPEPEVVAALALVPALPQAEIDARTTDVKSTAKGTSGTKEGERDRMARMQGLDRWTRQARVAALAVEIVLTQPIVSTVARSPLSRAACSIASFAFARSNVVD